MADLLITGASGFLGSVLMEQAARRGLDAVGLTHSHPLCGPGRGIQVDLRDADGLKALVQSERPRAIIHAGAISSPDYCEEHPEEADAVNVTATARIALLAFVGDAHFTFVSTDLVFDGECGMYREEDHPGPINRYARTKAAAEHLVRASNPEAAVARPSFLYGRPRAPHHSSFSHNVEQRLRAGEPTSLFHDQYRSPILVDAFAEACLELSDRRMAGVWHVGGADRVSRLQFGLALAEAAGLDASLLTGSSADDVQSAAPRPRDVSLDSAKARHRLQTALPSLTDGFHFLYGKGG